MKSQFTSLQIYSLIRCFAINQLIRVYYKNEFVLLLFFCFCILWFFFYFSYFFRSSNKLKHIAHHFYTMLKVSRFLSFSHMFQLCLIINKLKKNLLFKIFNAYIITILLKTDFSLTENCVLGKKILLAPEFLIFSNSSSFLWSSLSK